MSSRHARGTLHNAYSGSSVVVQQWWGEIRSCKDCGLFPSLFTELRSRRFLGRSHKSQPILSPLSYIAVSYPGYKNSTGYGEGATKRLVQSESR